MLVNKNEHLVYCAGCKAWYSLHTEVFLHVLYEGSVTCKKDHLVGHEHDKEYIDIFPIKEYIPQNVVEAKDYRSSSSIPTMN